MHPFMCSSICVTLDGDVLMVNEEQSMLQGLLLVSSSGAINLLMVFLYSSSQAGHWLHSLALLFSLCWFDIYSPLLFPLDWHPEQPGAAGGPQSCSRGGDRRQAGPAQGTVHLMVCVHWADDQTSDSGRVAEAQI